MARFMLALIAVLVLGAGRANACSCARVSIDEMIATTAIVFEGEVVDVRTAAGGDGQVTTIRVVRPIKGDVTGTVAIATRTMSAACGYDFRGKDKHLTVGAYPGQEGGLTTNLCVMFALNPRRP